MEAWGGGNGGLTSDEVLRDAGDAKRVLVRVGSRTAEFSAIVKTGWRKF